MPYRKNIVDLTSQELNDLAFALNNLPSEVIEKNVELHDEFFSRGIHRGPVFLPWHRYFLIEFEKELQKIQPDVMLPYWDWMLNSGRDLDEGVFKSFFGGRNNRDGRIKGNWQYQRGETPWADLPESFSETADELLSTSFFEFRTRVEYGSHASAHGFVGGDMASPRSPADPLFYLLHCNIDRMWAYWQHNNLHKAQYSTEIRSNENSMAAVDPYDLMVGDEETPFDMVWRKGFTYLYTGDIFYMLGIAVSRHVVFDMSDEVLLDEEPFLFRISTRRKEQMELKPKPSPPPIVVPVSIRKIFGNRRTKNFHRVNCIFKRMMHRRNEVSFPSINAALDAGYDGCGFCCRRYHKS